MLKKIDLHSILSCFLLLFLIACKNEDRAHQIILNALEAHGGIKKWENTKEITYLKTTILYDSLGKIEKKGIQKHKNIFLPEFIAEMSWQEDSIHKRVFLKNGKTQVFYNDSLQKDIELQKKYFKNIKAANYVLWQPYKLLDADVKLSFLGIENIDDVLVHTVQAAYYNSDGSPTNTWWFYFDVSTNRLLGNMVHHGTTYSFIKNSTYEEKTGLFLNAERKSYRTDSLRNIKYLRAHYFYEILSLK